jgi:hypothetical protein
MAKRSIGRACNNIPSRRAKRSSESTRVERTKKKRRAGKIKSNQIERERISPGLLGQVCWKRGDEHKSNRIESNRSNNRIKSNRIKSSNHIK